MPLQGVSSVGAKKLLSLLQGVLKKWISVKVLQNELLRGVPKHEVLKGMLKNEVLQGMQKCIIAMNVEKMIYPGCN